MLCTLHSADGPLLGAGHCEVHNSHFRMVTQQWYATPQEGHDAMLTLEDGRALPVRVTNVHIATSGPESSHTEVYDLAPLADRS